MMRLLMAVIVMAFAAMPVMAQAPTEPPLVPATQWQVDYAENECRLMREFGTGQDRVFLRITRASSLERYDFIVAGPGIPDLPLRRSTRLRLVPQGFEIVSNGYSMQVPSQDFHFIRLLDINTSWMGQLQPGQLLTISNGDFSVTLRLDNVVRALAALQTCHDTLLTEWGFDVAAYRALLRAPQPDGNEATWVTTEDYPAFAVSTGREGSVTVLLRVSTAGRVSACSILATSGFTELDSAACEAFTRRARFVPALGAGGNLVEAPYVRRVIWQLPERG